MIKFCADRIISFLIKNNAINGEDSHEISIYHYGVEITLGSIINIFLIVLLGILTNTISDSVIFLLVFIPLRLCTGGFHAETYIMCNIVLGITYLCVMFVVYFFSINVWGKVIILLLSFAVVYAFAPRASKHKKMTFEKRSRFKIVCRIVWIVVGVITLCFPIHLYKLQMNIILTMGAISVLIVIDFIINEREEIKKWLKKLQNELLRLRKWWLILRAERFPCLVHISLMNRRCNFKIKNGELFLRFLFFCTAMQLWLFKKYNTLERKRLEVYKYVFMIITC